MGWAAGALLSHLSGSPGSGSWHQHLGGQTEAQGGPGRAARGPCQLPGPPGHAARSEACPHRCALCRGPGGARRGRPPRTPVSPAGSAASARPSRGARCQGRGGLPGPGPGPGSAGREGLAPAPPLDLCRPLCRGQGISGRGSSQGLDGGDQLLVRRSAWGGSRGPCLSLAAPGVCLAVPAACPVGRFGGGHLTSRLAVVSPLPSKLFSLNDPLFFRLVSLFPVQPPAAARWLLLGTELRFHSPPRL